MLGITPRTLTIRMGTEYRESTKSILFMVMKSQTPFSVRTDRSEGTTRAICAPRVALKYTEKCQCRKNGAPRKNGVILGWILALHSLSVDLQDQQRFTTVLGTLDWRT